MPTTTTTGDPGLGFLHPFFFLDDLLMGFVVVGFQRECCPEDLVTGRTGVIQLHQAMDLSQMFVDFVEPVEGLRTGRALVRREEGVGSSHVSPDTVRTAEALPAQFTVGLEFQMDVPVVSIPVTALSEEHVTTPTRKGSPEIMDPDMGSHGSSTQGRVWTERTHRSPGHGVEIRDPGLESFLTEIEGFHLRCHEGFHRGWDLGVFLSSPCLLLFPFLFPAGFFLSRAEDHEFRSERLQVQKIWVDLRSDPCLLQCTPFSGAVFLYEGDRPSDLNLLLLLLRTPVTSDCSVLCLGLSCVGGMLGTEAGETSGPLSPPGGGGGGGGGAQAGEPAFMSPSTAPDSEGREVSEGSAQDSASGFASQEGCPGPEDPGQGSGGSGLRPSRTRMKGSGEEVMIAQSSLEPTHGSQASKTTREIGDRRTEACHLLVVGGGGDCGAGERWGKFRHFPDRSTRKESFHRTPETGTDRK